MHNVDIYFPPSFSGLPNVQYLIEYRCISWGVASFLEGKIWGLCLVQLCAKCRLVSAMLSPYRGVGEGGAGGAVAPPLLKAGGPDPPRRGVLCTPPS